MTAIHSPSILAVAAHECGHAITRLAIDQDSARPGPRIQKITALAGAEFLGETFVDLRISRWARALWPADPECLRSARLDMIETCAGPIAEQRWNNGSRMGSILHKQAAIGAVLKHTFVHGRFHDDDVLRLIGNYLAEAMQQPLQDLLDRLWLAAYALVEAEWAGISAMARTLSAAGTMEGQEFQEAWAKIRPGPTSRARCLAAIDCSAAAALEWALTPAEVMA